MTEELKEELEELINFRSLVQSDEFQKFLMKPLMKELDKVKNAYDCNTLAELKEVKGEKKGLMFVIKTLKQTEAEYQNKKDEINDSE